MSKITRIAKASERGVTAEITTITPQAAKDWLALNNNFRKLSEAKATNLANQIAKGRWELNGESIKFDRDGNLVDGQHRLRAVVMSKTPIQSLVVRGVTADNVDTGTNRTLSQLFGAKGVSDPGTSAGCVVQLYNWRVYRDFNPHGPYVSRTEALEIVNKEQGILESVRFTAKTRKLFGRHPLHACIHYLFTEKTNSEFANDFYATLISGTGLKDTNPIYHLRERLIHLRNSPVKASRNLYAGMIIHAWNQWLDNKPVKRLRFDFDKEGIPKIQGLVSEGE